MNRHRLNLGLLPLSQDKEGNPLGATVVESITPNVKGYVKFQGVLWRATCLQPITIKPGQIVRVVDRQSLTLIVEPVEVEPVEFQDYKIQYF
jgi:membrane-bound ClpP family serine protease